MLVKQKLRSRRHFHIRKRVQGTAERPRMAVFRSNRHLYVQLVDDEAGHTLASASTLDLRSEGAAVTANRQTAVKVGALIADRAKGKNITNVVFDRGGFKFHGKVKALAEAAREAGLKF
ncbi:MAG: 50S ribosomal protein L18 [bacterium]|nr:50S ribosomal protein L18 [bacterium]